MSLRLFVIVFFGFALGCTSADGSPLPSQAVVPQDDVKQPDAFETNPTLVTTVPIETGPIDARRGEEAGQDSSVPIVTVDAEVNTEAEASRPRCGDGTSEDVDGDGFTVAQGDCDDCLKTVNPAAYDIPDNAIDEDCDGVPVTNAECDKGLAVDSQAAEDGARAIGLCKFVDADSRDWGVVSARYTDASGIGEISDPLATGLLPNFGAAEPRAGESLLALSSGVARAPSQEHYTTGCDTFGSDVTCVAGSTGCNAAEPPPGYPKQSSSCRPFAFESELDNQVYNQAALELKIRVPSNANAIAFDSIFYTYEYPDWICEIFNDFFVVFKEPKPNDVTDGNIVFDVNHDPIGVNTALLSVCDPSIQSVSAGKTFTCDQGTDLLNDTGYGVGESECGGFMVGIKGGASTGWLQTTAPVEPGEIITLRFAIWDTADAALDSTVLIDNFRWITFEAEPEKQNTEDTEDTEDAEVLEVPVETTPVILI